MPLSLTVLAGVVAAGLVLLWVVHLRTDRDRRAAARSEWEPDDGTESEDLWTSGARCIRCSARPVLLSREAGQLWHTCMTCGHREARDTHA